jgi:hypothetical protein
MIWRLVREDHQDEQQSALDGWDDKEIRGGDLLNVVDEEGAPRLRRGRVVRTMYLATVA